MHTHHSPKGRVGGWQKATSSLKHFHHHISHKAAKSMAQLISQSCSVSACQGDMQPFEGNPSTCGCLTDLRNTPQQKKPRQLSASIPAWIVLFINVYNYRLMVISVSCCCVHESRLFSNLVTFVIWPPFHLYVVTDKRWSIINNCDFYVTLLIFKIWYL